MKGGTREVDSCVDHTALMRSGQGVEKDREPDEDLQAGNGKININWEEEK